MSRPRGAIRNWVRQADQDEDRREDGLTSEESQELRRLRRGVEQLTTEREILAKSAAWFPGETKHDPKKRSVP